MECTNFDRFREPDEPTENYVECHMCNKGILIDTNEEGCYEEKFYCFPNKERGEDFVCKNCLENYCDIYFEYEE